MAPFLPISGPVISKLQATFPTYHQATVTVLLYSPFNFVSATNLFQTLLLPSIIPSNYFNPGYVPSLFQVTFYTLPSPVLFLFPTTFLLSFKCHHYPILDYILYIYPSVFQDLVSTSFRFALKVNVQFLSYFRVCHNNSFFFFFLPFPFDVTPRCYPGSRSALIPFKVAFLRSFRPWCYRISATIITPFKLPFLPTAAAGFPSLSGHCSKPWESHSGGSLEWQLNE